MRDIAAPLHQQLTQQMLVWIRDGTWPPHFKLPNEPELAEQLNVSRGTLRKSVAALVESGHLSRVHGRGTFVLPPELEQPLAHEMIGIGDAFDRQGVSYTTDVLALTGIAPDIRIANLLGNRGGPVLYLRRLRRVSGEPVALLDNYVNIRDLAGLPAHDFSQERLFAAIESELGQSLSYARRTFQAVSASTEVAHLLNIKVGDPVLYLEQITYLQAGDPIEYSDVWIRGDQMKISALLQRPARTDVTFSAETRVASKPSVRKGSNT